MLVCLVFWLIFGIIGVQIYGGKFFHCVDSDGIRLPIDIVNNYSDCKANENKGYEWKNEAIHFDNIMAAYLALLQVVSNTCGFDLVIFQFICTFYCFLKASINGATFGSSFVVNYRYNATSMYSLLQV